MPPATWTPAATAQEEREATEYLARIAARKGLEGVQTEVGVYAGPIALTLVLAAQTRQADLLVMTTRGPHRSDALGTGQRRRAGAPRLDTAPVGGAPSQWGRRWAHRPTLREASRRGLGP